MKINKIIVTGPACCGKSTLCKDLAQYYNTIHVPEYAREYVLNLKQPYNYNDVETIAYKQIELVENALQKAISANKEFLFIDTYLVIILVWFERVFNKIPGWITGKLWQSDDFIYLLCKPDIQWVPDPAREYGPEKRVGLFNRYEELLKTNNKKFYIIDGIGKKRLEHAIAIIHSFC